MEKSSIFVYSWHIDDEVDDLTWIRIYGLNSKNESVCLSVTDFTPYVYVELPSERKWTDSMALSVGECLDRKLGDNKSVKRQLVYKKKLYYANVDIQDKGAPKYKLFPYLFMSFKTVKAIRFLQAIIKKKVMVSNVGLIKMVAHEHNASPILQLTCKRNIPTAGWISFKGRKISKNETQTYCDYEYVANYRNLSPIKSDVIQNPLVLSYDIEVYSSNPTRMPDSRKPTDKIFQISCILNRDGKDEYESYLLTLGEPDDKVFDEDVEIWQFKNESELLVGFTEFVVEKNPQVITGYNIFGFDIPYMLDRAKHNFVITEFDKQGMMKGFHSKEKLIKWSSQAYKDQEFTYIDAEGRLYVDLLPIVKRDFKFDTYSLKNVSKEFIGETKDPLTAKDIFRCYELGMEGGNKGAIAMGVVGKYCVKDAVLVTKLFKILQTWVGLCEMAKTCNVPIFTLYTQGQQIKVFSQIYKQCMYTNFVVEKLDLVPGDNEKYQGATVFPPKPGLYDKVVPFDFSSLYPTTMIAYNIDYSALVKDESIPDDKCHIFDWENEDEDTGELIKYHYRFLKSPKGVVPTLLENLLEARSKTKKQMKEVKQQISECDDEEKKEELRTLFNVLDKRQLSFKVSCNSAYGAMGVKRGYLPFLPGAMCTTAMGRKNLLKAADYIQSAHGGELIYGDTDSNYIHFPNIDTAPELWDFCFKVEKEMLDIFPPPMKMAFEEKIYWRFFIITKKRYMALSCERDGVLDEDVYKKGVLLARRDNSKFIRDTYAKVIMPIFERTPKDDVLYIICNELNRMCSSSVNFEDFVITKSVGDISGYKIRELPTDEKKREKRIKDLGINPELQSIPASDSKYRNRFEEMYILRNLPAQVQLAERMKRRGKVVQSGSRIPYVITTMGGVDAKQFVKIEDPSYQQEHSDIIKIDYLYYLHLLINPIDQLLEVAYKMEKFMKSQHKLRVQKYKMCRQIDELFNSTIDFVSESS